MLVPFGMGVPHIPPIPSNAVDQHKLARDKIDRAFTEFWKSRFGDSFEFDDDAYDSDESDFSNDSNEFVEIDLSGPVKVVTLEDDIAAVETEIFKLKMDHKQLIAKFHADSERHAILKKEIGTYEIKVDNYAERNKHPLKILENQIHETASLCKANELRRIELVQKILALKKPT